MRNSERGIWVDGTEGIRRARLGAGAYLVAVLLGACGDDSGHPGPGELNGGSLVDGGVPDASRFAPERDAESPPTVSTELYGISGIWRLEMRARYISEPEYTLVELTQSSTKVTGRECYQEYDESFQPVSTTCLEQTFSGTFVEPDLHLTQRFEEDGQTHTLTLDVVSNADQSRFEGGGHSTKCGCSFNVTAARAVIPP